MTKKGLWRLIITYLTITWGLLYYLFTHPEKIYVGDGLYAEKTSDFTTILIFGMGIFAIIVIMIVSNKQYPINNIIAICNENSNDKRNALSNFVSTRFKNSGKLSILEDISDFCVKDMDIIDSERPIITLKLEDGRNYRFVLTKKSVLNPSAPLSTSKIWVVDDIFGNEFGEY